MKAFRSLLTVVLTSGLLSSCGDALDQISSGEDTGYKASLTASPAAQKISNEGTATVTFRFGFTSVVGIQETDLSKYTQGEHWHWQLLAVSFVAFVALIIPGILYNKRVRDGI